MATNDIPDKEAKKQLARLKSRVEAEIEELHLQYLNIMPMMDMMTILLVFLLKQFAVTAAAATQTGLTLPSSAIEKASQQALNITVTQTAILVDGEAITPVRAGAVDPAVKKDGANSFFITPLVDTLTKHANKLKKAAVMQGTQFEGTATVMIDKATPYRLLTEVLYSAGQAEFANYRLVVIKRGQ